MSESLFTSLAWPSARNPRRAEVLAAVDRVLPWGALEKIAAPLYPAPAKTGRPRYSLQLMLRTFVVQWLLQLSDDGVENAILDSHAVARFVRLDPWKPRPPGASSIRSFRHLMLRDRPIVAAPWFEMSHLIDLALNGAGAELRLGRIIEPQLRRRSGPKSSVSLAGRPLDIQGEGRL